MKKKFFRAVIFILCFYAVAPAQGQNSSVTAGSAVVRKAQAEVGGWARDFGGRSKSDLVDVMMQREAALKRMEEVSIAKEKLAMGSFAVAMLASGKLTEDRFWDIAPASTNTLRGRKSIGFYDGSSLRFGEQTEKNITIVYDNLTVNACRVLTEALIERTLDNTGPSNLFKKNELISLEFGAQTLAVSQFQEAKIKLVSTDASTQIWVASKDSAASRAAITVLTEKTWDPCLSMRPGEGLILKLRKN